MNDQSYDAKAGGGGFTSSQSPAIGGTQEKKKRSQNVVPLAIGQILENKEENLTICGHEVHMVSLLGIVNKIDHVTTKITYTIADSTGEIAALKWLEGDGSDVSTIMENTYVSVVGTARTQQGRKHVMIFKIQPLYDINQITTHILQVIKTPFALEAINKQQQNGGGGGDVTNQSMNNSSMMTGGGVNVSMNQSVGGGGADGGVEASLNSEQLLVYRIIKCTTADEGVHKVDIMASLRGKMSTKAVETAVEFLSNEGHVYSTVDEDHYKTTEDS